jgi:peptidylprolyl isomerase
MKRRQFCQVFAATALGVLTLPGRAFAATLGDEGATVYQWTAPPPMGIDPSTSYTAYIMTSLGEMTAELYAKDAPNTVNNFVFLAREGFYNWVVFHRVVKEFMVQTGDPTGTGRGGPGYRFEDELSGPQTYVKGTLAMANAGPNTQGSQFFICHGGRAEALPKRYSIFGRVTVGLDVLDAIASVPVQAAPHGEVSSPVEPPVIESIVIVEGADGAPAP